MKKILNIIIIFVCLLSATQVDAARKNKKSRYSQPKVELTKEPTVFKDSVTGAELTFPEGAVLLNDTVWSIMLSYPDQKRVIRYDSWRNEEDKPFDWQQISRVDNEPFERLLSQKRLDGPETDGWQRLYNFTDTKTPHYYLVTLLRSDRSAILLTEQAADTTQFITDELLANGKIPPYTHRPLVSDSVAWWLGIALMILLFLITRFWKFKPAHKERNQWLVILVGYIIAFLFMVFAMKAGIWASLGIAAAVVSLPALLLFSGSWGTFFENILSNL